MGAPAAGQVQQPFNLQQGVAQGMQQAGQTSAQGTNFQAPQLSNTNLQPYQNLFESQVVDQSLQDLERSRLMQQNQMGASATRAGAFGGSRHGIAEAETNRGYADQAARTASQLRAGGFENAQNMAQADLNRQMQAQQYRQQSAGQLGQQATIGYDMAQGISNQMQQQGAQNQAINQALIDAARNQYGGFQGAPMQGASMMVGAQPNIRTGDTTTTDTYKAGLSDYAQMAASMYNPVGGGLTGALGGIKNLFGGPQVKNPFTPDYGMASMYQSNRGGALGLPPVANNNYLLGSPLTYGNPYPLQNNNGSSKSIQNLNSNSQNPFSLLYGN